jgi:hypothetical protein
LFPSADVDADCAVLKSEFLEQDRNTARIGCGPKPGGNFAAMLLHQWPFRNAVKFWPVNSFEYRQIDRFPAPPAVS